MAPKKAIGKKMGLSDFLGDSAKVEILPSQSDGLDFAKGVGKGGFGGDRSDQGFGGKGKGKRDDRSRADDGDWFAKDAPGGRSGSGGGSGGFKRRNDAPSRGDDDDQWRSGGGKGTHDSRFGGKGRGAGATERKPLALRPRTLPLEPLRPDSEVFVKFYRGEGTDCQGRRLKDIWAFNDKRLEEQHDYIQWIFPTDQASAYNSNAPDFPKQLQARFRKDPVIVENIQRSFNVYLKFLGFWYDSDAQKCVRTENFQQKGQNWLVPVLGPNHNWLRCSRVLHCLRLMEMIERRDAFYEALEQVYVDGLIPPHYADTVRYWQEYAGIKGRTMPTQKPQPQREDQALRKQQEERAARERQEEEQRRKEQEEAEERARVEEERAAEANRAMELKEKRQKKKAKNDEKRALREAAGLRLEEEDEPRELEVRLQAFEARVAAAVDAPGDTGELAGEVRTLLELEELQTPAPAKYLFRPIVRASRGHDEDFVLELVQRFVPVIQRLIQEAEEVWRYKMKFLAQVATAVADLKLPRLSPKSSLLEVIFDSLYQTELFEEQYFKFWAAWDDDKNPRKTAAVFQVQPFLEFLEKGRIQGEDYDDDQEFEVMGGTFAYGDVIEEAVMTMQQAKRRAVELGDICQGFVFEGVYSDTDMFEVVFMSRDDWELATKDSEEYTTVMKIIADDSDSNSGEDD